MRKINNKPWQEIESQLERITNNRTEIESLIEKLNAEMAQVFGNFSNENGETLDDLIETQNNLNEDLASLIEVQTDAMDDYQQDRAEAWHESEAADIFNEWMDEWQTLAEQAQCSLDAPELHQFQFELADELELPEQDRNQ